MLRMNTTKECDESKGKNKNFESKISHSGGHKFDEIKVIDDSVDKGENLAHKTSMSAINVAKIQALKKRIDYIKQRKIDMQKKDSETVVNQIEDQLKLASSHFRPTFSPICVRNKGFVGNKRFINAKREFLRKKKIKSFDDKQIKKNHISTDQNKFRINMVNLTFSSQKMRRRESRGVKSPLSSDMRTSTKLNSRYSN
jgi:hypothetical protein